MSVDQRARGLLHDGLDGVQVGAGALSVAAVSMLITPVPLSRKSVFLRYQLPSGCRLA